MSKPIVSSIAQGTIETDRLRLRRWQSTDLPFVGAILGDPEVMEFSDRGVLSKGDQAAWLQRTQAAENSVKGLGTFAIERRHDADVIGYISLSSDPERIAEGESEIGFRLAKHAWGRGFATEAVIAMIEMAGRFQENAKIVAIVDPDNLRSVRVLRKAGLTYERNIVFETYDHPDHLYTCRL